MQTVELLILALPPGLAGVAQNQLAQCSGRQQAMGELVPQAYVA